MKPGLVFTLLLLFQIAFTQGDYRSMVIGSSRGVTTSSYRNEIHVSARNYINNNVSVTSKEKVLLPTNFTEINNAPENIFPFLSAVLALSFIHVPGFLVGFPIPTNGLFNSQRAGSANQIKMSGGLLRRNQVGIILSF